MNHRIPRIIATQPLGAATQPLGAPAREESPGLLGLVTALSGAATPHDAARALLADLRKRLGGHFSAQLSLATPRPELLAAIEPGQDVAHDDSPFVVHWVDGDRELGSLRASGLSQNERTMLEAWTPWMQPAIKRLADTWAEREERALAERQARLWRIKAELLGLAQGPQSLEAYLAMAVIEVQRLLGASQVVFWTYHVEDDSLEARYHAVPDEADKTPGVPLGLFQEAVLSREVRTASLVGVAAEACVFQLAPVFGEHGLVGVLQAVLPEPTLGGVSEEELTACAEVLATGAKTVTFYEKLSYQASHDPLTGLPNRRTFQHALEREFKLARRHDQPLSLVVVDVDHFKRYNDTFGHAAGDSLLMAIGQALGTAARSTDFVARFGGEEFVAILPHTDAEGGKRAGEKLLDAIRQLHESAVVLSGQITASVGVATVGAGIDSPERLFEAADQAMYRAKQTGRNQVCQA